MNNPTDPLNADGRTIPSLRLIFSYVVDWLVVCGALGLGILFGEMTPNKRPFSLTNPEISYPFQNQEKVPTKMLGLYALAVPAFVIWTVCLVLVPGPTGPKSFSKCNIWYLRMWELHIGWLGLCFSLASSVLITGGMKNLFGKPRPDFLARCLPDLTNLQKYRLGGFYGTNVVSADICQQTDRLLLNDGFRSYPSGHSSFASGGLIYLSLFLASKLAISIPYLYQSDFHRYHKVRNAAFPTYSNNTAKKQEDYSVKRVNSNLTQVTVGLYDREEWHVSPRNQAAAPPLYLLVFVVIPFFASIYIASTRFSDFRHHGFDILFGYMIGLLTSILSFRFYHLPISQGAGWAWGPRSSLHSFWTGVGVGGFASSMHDWTDEHETTPITSTHLGDVENRGSTGPSNKTSDQFELLPIQNRHYPTEADLIPSKNK